MTWMLLVDRFPLPGRQVIIALVGGNMTTATCWDESATSFPFSETGSGYPYKASEVIAWMPMPPAPPASSSPAPGPS